MGKRIRRMSDLEIVGIHVEVAAGALISRAIEEAVAMAKEKNTNIFAEFNGVLLRVKPTSTVDEIYQKFAEKINVR
jgi:hypothetical protein